MKIKIILLHALLVPFLVYGSTYQRSNTILRTSVEIMMSYGDEDHLKITTPQLLSTAIEKVASGKANFKFLPSLLPSLLTRKSKFHHLQLLLD